MSRFVYTSPLLPGKCQAVKDHYKAKACEPRGKPQDTAEFFDLLGMKYWSCSLQHLAGKDYFIHCLETDNLKKLFQKLRELISANHPKALALRFFYLEVLGKDYCDPSTEPQVEQILDVSYPKKIVASDRTTVRTFMYPLLPGKTEAHIEYCQRCLNEDKELLRKSCQPFGITRMVKYLQTTPAGDCVTYYQEKVEKSSEQHRSDHQVLLAASAPCQWVSKNLMEHTGLTKNQLDADVCQLVQESTTDALAINNW